MTEQEQGHEFERRDRETGEITPIFYEGLWDELGNTYVNVDMAIMLMRQNRGQWIITTGFADY